MSEVVATSHHDRETDASTEAPKASDSLLYRGPRFPEPVDFRALVVRLVLGTSLVLALCASTVWIGKRWFGLGAPSASQNSRLSLVETLALGHRCYIQLVQADGQMFVLGLDAAGIKALVPFTEAFDSELARIEENHTLREDPSRVYPTKPRETEHVIDRRSWT
jgi:flagellar biogenesis protein FliO